MYCSLVCHGAHVYGMQYSLYRGYICGCIHKLVHAWVRAVHSHTAMVCSFLNEAAHYIYPEVLIVTDRGLLWDKLFVINNGDVEMVWNEIELHVHNYTIPTVHCTIRRYSLKNIRTSINYTCTGTHTCVYVLNITSSHT